MAVNCGGGEERRPIAAGAQPDRRSGEHRTDPDEHRSYDLS